jgi:threonine dehydrogenase-like Zn-dependent dehydrogenase
VRATLIHAPRDIRVEDVPDPRVQRAGDALVRVVAACVCGSDLWPYRGVAETTEPHRIGHEFVGVVEEIGSEVRTMRPGDFVIAPFALSDGTCVHCRNGVHTSCLHSAWWGGEDAEGLPIDGGQGEAVRVPMADGTLVVAADASEQPADAEVAGLLTLSDVMGTGHHAARAAGVGKGSTVVVVGDGAVGQCAVLAATRLGADRVIAMSRHADRQALARRLDTVAAVRAGSVAQRERGDDEVTGLDRPDVGADLLDDADELVPDPLRGRRGPHAAVRPQVGAADAGGDDADERVARQLDGGVRDVFETDVAGAVDEGCLHPVSLPRRAPRSPPGAPPGSRRPRARPAGRSRRRRPGRPGR